MYDNSVICLAEGAIQMNLPTWAVIALQVAFFAIIILVVYKQIKEKVLYKYNPNKWMILGLSGLVFLIPILIKEYSGYDMSGTVWQYVDSAVFIVLFLWFVDLSNGTIRKISEVKKNPAPQNKQINKAVNSPISE
jgi:hypothetical protein